MKFNARKTLLFSLMFVLLAGVVTIGVLAKPFNDFGRSVDFGGNGTNDTIRVDLMTAIDNADYISYMNALDKQWEAYRASITQDKFNEMVSHYKEMKNESINVPGNRRMMGGRGVMGRVPDGNFSGNISLIHDAEVKLQKALDSGDYTSWKEAVDTLNANAPSGMPHFINNMTDKITAENFATYVDFTKAVQDGDFNTAKQLATTLDIDGYSIPMMPMGGYGHGPMHGANRFGR